MNGHKPSPVKPRGARSVKNWPGILPKQTVTPQECFLRGAVNRQKRLKNYTNPPSIERKVKAPAGVSNQLSAAQLSTTVTQKTI